MDGFKTLPPSSGRLFAIGDIHGCVPETQTLLDHLSTNLNITPQDQIVFIGDYIDRGPDSRGAIELLIQFADRYPQTHFLRGNHEEMLLGFLGVGGSMGDLYLVNGGEDLLTSYGLSEEATPADLRSVMPDRHKAFFGKLERYLVSDKFVFVHAGLAPLRSLQGQLDQDIFWIRNEFIQNIHNFGKTVIFGHTPFEEVVFHLPYKIGIDTGLVYGNMLTCIELKEERIFQVRLGENIVKESNFPEVL